MGDGYYDQIEADVFGVVAEFMKEIGLVQSVYEITPLLVNEMLISFADRATVEGDLGRGRDQ